MTVPTVTDGDGTPQPNAAPPEPAPEIFRSAVESLSATTVRREVRVEPLRPPQRLAPYSYAVSAEINDRDGNEAWDGVLRLVAYASAELDDAMGVDPMLPAVGWSWLTDSLAERAAAYRAAGGTVTQTTSTRF